MRLDDIYRSDSRFDKMGAAQHIIDWYDEVYDLNDQRKADIDSLLGAQELSGSDPEALFTKLLQLDAQLLSKLYRNVKRIMMRR